MTKAYGPPLLGVGDSLSKQGISKYTEYNEIMRNKSTLYDGLDQIRRKHVAPEHQEAWDQADRLHFDQRSLLDFQLLVATKPVQLTMAEGTVEESKEEKISESAEKADTVTDAESSEAVGEPLIALNSVIVKYSEKTVLGFPPPQSGYDKPGLNFTIRRGTRLALLG
jgi:hypothetical protein